MPALPFPRSSTPGVLPGEGEGRLVNVLAEKQGDTDVIRRVPGLAAFGTAGASGCRGLFDLAGTLYGAFSGAVYRFGPAGGAGTLAGTLPGTDGVTFARNNRVTSGASTPDLIAVRESGGAYLVTASSVAAFTGGGNLPAAVNSVDFLGGYLLLSVADGRIFATGLNSTTVAALSFATAEARPDGLKRGIVHANTYYAMGESSVEPWINAGTSPFPLRRATSVMPVGLLAAMAVAGHEDGWGGNPTFVASDHTVREIRGYDAVRVSTPAVERFIAASLPEKLEASVHTFRGHRIWTLSSDLGTWEYNASTGQWHERASAGLARWMGSRSVRSNGAWIVGHTTGTALLKVDAATRTENGAALTATIESGALKGYPARIAIPALFAEFTRAAGGNVAMEYSRDGAATWSDPVSRSLATAERHAVRWNRLGLSGHHGLRARFTVSDAVDFAFLGASVPDPEPRKPA